MTVAPRAGEGGFTLLEVLVALAVLSAVLAGAFGVFSSGLKGLSRGDERLTLALVAESLLDRADLDLTRAAAEASGTMPDGLRWRVTKQPYDPARLQDGLAVVEAAPPRRGPGDDVDLLDEAAEESLLPREEGGGEEQGAEDGGSFFDRPGEDTGVGPAGEELGERPRPRTGRAAAAAGPKLRAYLLRAEVADLRGGSFALERLGLERAR